MNDMNPVRLLIGHRAVCGGMVIIRFHSPYDVGRGSSYNITASARFHPWRHHLV